jgi:stage III sporulation protein SpoIIIAA
MIVTDDAANAPMPSSPVPDGLRMSSDDEIETLLAMLPNHVGDRLRDDAEVDTLVEVVLDLGRYPEARFAAHEVVLDDVEVSTADLDAVTARIGAFGDDNRAGIPRTLHRISAIRNRHGAVVGLTCRVGRSIMGTVELVRDLVEGGKSILILGRPGVGKTTILREAARVLADDLRKRVVIVDTSNEIAGDGDIPHPGIGRARRMQVPTPSKQHAVMIEAVENHMPQVIVIDEIGTALEAEAARTIAERGVQLVATAHGMTLDNLLMNPTLTDLVGGVQTVTLGDDEARRRGTQKTILERKVPPTFDVLIEMQDRQQVVVHRDVAVTVDGLLRGTPVLVEARLRRADGTIDHRAEVTLRGAEEERRRSLATGAIGPYGGGDRHDTRQGWGRPPWRERGGWRGVGGSYRQQTGAWMGGAPETGFEGAPDPASWRPTSSSATAAGAVARKGWAGRVGVVTNGVAEVAGLADHDNLDESTDHESATRNGLDTTVDDGTTDEVSVGRLRRPVRVFCYGVNRGKLDAAILAQRLPVTLTRELSDAEVVMTVRNYYRTNPGPVRDAEERGLPVFVVKSNAAAHIAQSLEAVFEVQTADPPRDLEDLVLAETRDAIETVRKTSRQIELAPQNAYIRRLQHQLAEEFGLGSRSTGREPHRRITLFRRTSTSR